MTTLNHVKYPILRGDVGMNVRSSLTSNTVTSVLVGTVFWEMKSLVSGLEMQIRLMSTVPV